MARKENFMTEEHQNENIEENKEQNTENQESIKVSKPISSNKNKLVNGEGVKRANSLEFAR